jgi:hypothetical protein
MRGASRRTRAIAEGLVRTGPASAPRTVGTYIRLRARVGRAGRFYWVAVDGGELETAALVVRARQCRRRPTRAMLGGGDA